MAAFKYTKKTLSRVFRALKILLRAAAFLLLLAVFLVGSAVLALRFLVTPEHVRAFVSTELQEILHRPVQIGSIDLLVFQGLRVRGLRVLESPDFPGQEFITSEVLLAKYQWRALLNGRLDFTELRLVAPRIRLLRREDGRWNIEDIFSEKASGGAMPRVPLSALPVSLVADMLSVDHGDVEIDDRKEGQRRLIRDFNLEVRRFNTKGPFAAKFSFQTSGSLGGKPIRLAAAATGSLSLAGFRWAEAFFQAEKIRAVVDGERLSGSGSLKNFTAPQVDLRVELPRIDSATLSRYRSVPSGIAIPASQLRLKARMPAPGDFRVDLLEWWADPLRLRAKLAYYPVKNGRAFELSAGAPALSLQRISQLWTGLERYRLAGSADANVILYGVPQDPNSPIGIKKLMIQARGLSLSLPKDRRFSAANIRFTAQRRFAETSLQASGAAVNAYGSRFADINAGVTSRQEKVEVERLDFSWNGSHVKLKGKLEGLASPKSVYVEGSVDRLALKEAIRAVSGIVEELRGAPGASPAPAPAGPRKWSQVLKYSIPKTFPAISGRLRISDLVYPNFNTFNLELSWQLTGISTGLRKASGSVRTAFGPGRVSNIPELQNEGKVLRVLFLPFVFMHRLNNSVVFSLQTAYPKTLDFTRLYGEYGLRQGVVDVRMFYVDSPQLLAFADGKVDFPREKVDMHVLTRLTSSRGPLPEALSDEKGRPSIGFFVRQDLNKPTVEVQFRKMGANAIEDALQQALRRTGKSF